MVTSYRSQVTGFRLKYLKINMQFEDLDVWKITEKLILEIYKISKQINDHVEK